MRAEGAERDGACTVEAGNGEERSHLVLVDGKVRIESGLVQCALDVKSKRQACQRSAHISGAATTLHLRMLQLSWSEHT